MMYVAKYEPHDEETVATLWATADTIVQLYYAMIVFIKLSYCAISAVVRYETDKVRNEIR